MGRKGIGKLAALSVSANVLVMTRKNGEESGFVLSRHVDSDHRLRALPDDEIHFAKIEDGSDGTSIVMTNPQYALHKTTAAIKNNILKIFPLVSPDFRIHIITDKGEFIVDSFDKEIIKGLGALIILGDEFRHLDEYFDCGIDDENFDEDDKGKRDKLIEFWSPIERLLKLRGIDEVEKDYNLVIKGWIGVEQQGIEKKTLTTSRIISYLCFPTVNLVNTIFYQPLVLIGS
jgi:hypothetical protein